MQVSKVTDLPLVPDCPQAFTDRTVSVPAIVPQVHVMEVVPWPAVMTPPVGKAHCCVTPATAGVVNTTPV